MEKSSKSFKDLSKLDIEQAFGKTIAKVSVPRGRFELVTPERYEAVCEIVKNYFIVDEPVHRSSGLSWSTEMKDIWQETFSHNLSFVLINEENGDLMSFAAIQLTSKEDHADTHMFTDEGLRKLMAFFNYASQKFNVHKEFNVNEIFDFMGLGVTKKYRRQGLAGIMVDVGVNFIRNLGVSLCFMKTMATSNFSQTIFENYGFELLKEFPYDRYRPDGEVVFTNTGEHKSMKMFLLRL